MTPGAVALDIEDWSPIPLDELPALLGTEKSWWIAGGVALDLFLGHIRRAHHDVDVAILRRDQLAFRERLADWDPMVPTGEWEGEPNRSKAFFRSWVRDETLAREVGNVWCRRAMTGQWEFDLLLSEGDARSWIFKKDESISLPWTVAAMRSAEGIPFLAPQIVLLHNAVSTWPGEHADSDFEAVIPHLEREQRQWLLEKIGKVAPAHAWVTRLHSLEER